MKRCYDKLLLKQAVKEAGLDVSAMEEKNHE